MLLNFIPKVMVNYHHWCNTYRSDVEEGGETVFPAAGGNYSATPGWNEKSACAKRGLSVKPKRGDALLFWSMRPDATLDPSSLHGKRSHCFPPPFLPLTHVFFLSCIPWNENVIRENSWSTCRRKVMVFMNEFNFVPNAGGCPVIKGNKWSCTKWLHVGEYKV